MATVFGWKIRKFVLILRLGVTKNLQLQSQLMVDILLAGPAAYLVTEVNNKKNVITLFANMVVPSAVVQPFKFQLTKGMVGYGRDISCGHYGSQAALESACTADGICLVYTQYNGRWWCLKTTSSRPMAHNGKHIYWRKVFGAEAEYGIS
jgi:hypothetical protein